MPRRSHSIRCQARAFTLVEVLLAGTVMLVGIVGMMFVIRSGSEMLDASRRQTIATQIMHGEIERVRVSDWTQITALAPTQEGYAESTGGRVVQWVASGSAIPADVFRFSRTISSVQTDMKQITYTVAWTGNTGHPYTRSASTYVGKNGLYVAYQR